MLKDENTSLYGYALMAAGAVVSCAFLLRAPEVEVARLTVDTIEAGAIETASIPEESGPRGASEWGAPAIPWRTYEDGMAEMARTGKPALMILQAEWCLVCRNYQRQFEKPEIKRWADKYVFILADVDETPDLQKRYNVDGDYIPRTFLIAPDGGLRRDATGSHTRQRFYVDPYRADELSALLENGL